MKHLKQSLYAILLSGCLFTGCTQQSTFPKPVKHVFESYDGVHVLYKQDSQIEDILIELEDERDLYNFDINGTIYTLQLFRHCTIGTCDVVDIAIDGEVFEVNSFIK